MRSSESDRENENNKASSSSVFGVESGGLIIGLGLFILFFGIVSFVSGSAQSCPSNSYWSFWAWGIPGSG